MSMSESARNTFAMYNQGKQPNHWDFYRCWSCGWLFTLAQERRALAMMTPDREYICKCRSMKYTASFPRFYEWLKLPVASYGITVVLVRVVVPWLEKHFASAIPIVEALVKQRKFRG